MSRNLVELISKKLVNIKKDKIVNYQKPVLDFTVKLTNKVIDQFDEKKINVDVFSGRPGIIIQQDRTPVEIPSHIETSEHLEEFVKALLMEENLAIKLEVDGVVPGILGGIFKWYPAKDNLLLIILYVVDADRVKHRKTQKVTYPIRLQSQATDKNLNELNLGRLLFGALHDIKGNQREQLDSDYKRFLGKSFKPFSEFLKYEKLSIRDPRFRPQCNYVKQTTTERDDRGFLEVSEPPRQLTEGGNQISAKDANGNSYSSVRIADFDDSEQLLIIDEGYRLKDWPDEGIIFLTGDLASNRRKTQAVNLLRVRKDPIYAKLADTLIRPWGLPEVNVEPRSYFHPNISHTNLISEAQAQAIDLALSGHDISLIHGPPGTGKTTVIVEIIRHVISNEGRVLMVAPTHVAVDNVLERITDTKGISAVRVGGKQYMDAHLKKYRLRDKIQALKESLPSFTLASKRNSVISTLQAEFIKRMESKDKRHFENLVLQQSNLVCGTTIGIARYYENTTGDQIDFDILIIDEASKATVMEFLVPAVRAKCWVLVGDHRQLPPYINDQELRIYIQRYFEEKHETVETQAKHSSNKSDSSNIFFKNSKTKNDDFHEQTDELIGNLRRFHEELHALNEGDPDRHWARVIQLMDYNRKPIKSIEEMINLALGSCFHYFLRRVDNSRNVVLTVQHRMPSILANFLDDAIYSGKLKTSESAATHGLTLPKIANLGVPEISEPLIFLSTEMHSNPRETPGKRKGYYNTSEVESIKSVISSIAKIDAHKLGYTENSPMTVGVITYYADQSRVIIHKLRQLKRITYTRGWRFRVAGKPIQIRVSIVDRFQGQEQDIVILSLTRSNSRGDIGFLANLQRINVSLSRAKQNLLVVGNHKFFYYLRPKGNRRIILKELANYCLKNHLVRKLNPIER